MATSGKPIDDHDRSRVMRWYSAGVSMREIARRELLSLPTVRKILGTAVDKFRTPVISSVR